jgi:hypothetical protein
MVVTGVGGHVLGVVRTGLFWRGLQRVDGAILELEDAGVEALVPDSGVLFEISSALRDAPPTVHLADGSTLFGDVMLAPRHAPSRLPDRMLLSDPWQGVELTRELDPDGSVQARTAELAAADAEWVATDHGSGELADFMSIARDGDAVRVRLYHCKGAGGRRPGRRVGDLYDVVGQAIKCVPWTLAQASLWHELTRRLEHREAFRLLHGDREAFTTQLERLVRDLSAHVRIKVIAVQPGVSISDVHGWSFGRSLLYAAAEWCEAENTRFLLLGSE